MKHTRSQVPFILTALFALSGLSAHADIDHLATPLLYDNAEFFDNDNPTTRYHYGQTFLATDATVGGVRLYIGDPTRPGVTEVNELSGPAELVLYGATNLLSPVELGRSLVVPNAQSVQGLITFSFSSPIPTTIGSKYFFAISTTDDYGLGLRNESASTYADGAEAVFDTTTTTILEGGGRDISFAVLQVPEPSSAMLLMFGAVFYLGRGTLRTTQRSA